MEVNETTELGAIRETWEEAKASVEIVHLHGIYNIPRINQVYVFYLAKMLTPDFETTIESTEIKLYDKKDIPWDQLAFKVVDTALRQYLGKNDDEKVHSPYFHSEISPPLNS